MNRKVSPLKEIIAKLESEVNKGKAQSRTESVPIGSELKQLTIINLPVDLLILNPKNHRIAAQIKDGDLLAGLDPSTKSAQDIIENLLAETDQFSALKNELKALGQRDVGIISRDGLLINGNTRCAALRALHKEGDSKSAYMDVAILPGSTNQRQVTDLEIDLQMVKLTHQDYTFTNELLLIDEVLSNNTYTEKELAKRMNRRVNTIKKKVRILKIIKEVRQMSNPKIAWKVFDQKETHLNDLDEKMQSLIATNEIAAAENVKYARIFAIFIGLNKDHVREVDDNTFQEIRSSVKKDTAIKKYLNKHEIKRDDDFDDDDLQINVDSQGLLKDFLSTPNIFDENSIVNDSAAGDHIKDLTEELNAYTDLKIIQGRRRSRDEGVITTLRNLRNDIVSIYTNLEENLQSDYFKRGDFEYEIDKAKKDLDELLKIYYKLRPVNDR